MSIWIAGFLGPVILALSIPMMVTPTTLQETSRRFLDDRPLVLISGVLAMVAGLAIVKVHNVWTADWTLLVTLFGWALLIGGAVRVAAPPLVTRIGGAMLERPVMTRIAGVVWALLGAFLTFKAYG